METRRVGNNNLTLSRIGIGCWAFGGGDYWGAQNQRDVDEVVRRALDAGINFFDTARMYNNGASEKSLGLALEGVRGKAVICSKVSPAKAYRSALKKECEESLKNLKTDYIDIYMMHWPINPYGIMHFTDYPKVLADPPTSQEAFAALEELKKEGKIREIGVSNYGVKQLTEAYGCSPQIAVNEMPYNIVSRAIEAEVVPACEKMSVGVITSMTLQQGLLAGIFNRAEDVPPHQAHSRHFAQERGQGHSRHFEPGAEEEIFTVAGQLKEIAGGLGISVPQLAIRWVLSKPWLDSALIGSRNKAELDENIIAASSPLPGEVSARIDEISLPVLKKLGNNPDYYENTKNSRIY